ncbi:MAG: hypothetical protein GY765_12060 [bacterium]|nr:hypothetical protein [bacterium]
MEEVGVEDNFFHIGGHSIKAIQATNLIHKELGSEVGLTGIFQNPTIAELAQVVRDKQGGGFAGIQPLEPAENYQLSYAQKRLWVLQRIDLESSAYNMPEHLPIHEPVDVPILEQVIEDIVMRHESLRTRFYDIEGEPVQVIDSENRVKLQTVDISHLAGDAQEAKMAALYNEEFSTPFDIEKGPLLRVKLIKYAEDRFDFLFTMHHIVSDGWSMDVLKREFHQLYESYRKKEDFILEPMKIQYKDFAAWQNALFADPSKMQAAKDFWKDQLSRQLPILNLPRESTYAESHREGEASPSAVYRIVVPGETAEKLKQLAGEYNASLFMVLLSGFNLFLSNLTGNDEIMVSMAGAGREHEDLKHLVGFFINTLVVKNYVDNSETYIELLKRVQSNTLKVLDYQNYPLELIVDELKLKYPKVSVFLNMLNIGEGNLQTLEDTEPYHEEQSQDTKFDMTCYLTEYANGIEVVCNYLPIAFKAETIEYIMGEFVKVLGRIAEDPNKTPKEYTASPKRRKLKRIKR